MCIRCHYYVGINQIIFYTFKDIFVRNYDISDTTFVRGHSCNFLSYKDLILVKLFFFFFVREEKLQREKSEDDLRSVRAKFEGMAIPGYPPHLGRVWKAFPKPEWTTGFSYQVGDLSLHFHGHFCFKCYFCKRSFLQIFFYVYPSFNPVKSIH